MIQQTQRTIDELDSSPSLLSLDTACRNKRVTRLPRPDVQESQAELAEDDQSDDESADGGHIGTTDDTSLNTHLQSHEQTSQQLPALTANPLTTASESTSASSVIVVPSPHAPVVSVCM